MRPLHSPNPLDFGVFAALLLIGLVQWNARALRTAVYARPLPLLALNDPARSSHRSVEWSASLFPLADIDALAIHTASQARLTRHHCLAVSQIGIPLRIIVFASPFDPLVNPRILSENNTTKLGRFKRDDDGTIEVIRMPISLTLSYSGKYGISREIILDSKDAECVFVSLQKFI